MGGRRSARPRRRAFELAQAGQQVGKTLALHDDVVAHRVDREFGVAVADRVDDALVLFERALQPVAHPQLQAPVGPQLALQRLRLFGQEGVVRAVVDGAVETFVGVEVGVGIELAGGAAAALVRGLDSRQIGLGGAPRRLPGAHRLQLGHHLEHLDQPGRTDRRHHRATARAQFHQPFGGELDQRLAHGGARDAVALDQQRLVERAAGRQLAGGDLLLDGFAQAVGDLHARIVAAAAVMASIGRVREFTGIAKAFNVTFNVYIDRNQQIQIRAILPGDNR